jgi:DNA-binding response OmpR family regulator
LATPPAEAAREILVAEHDPAVAELIRRYLAREGLAVRYARDAAETVAELTAGGSAAVVLDLTMPGLDARQIRRLLRRGPAAGPARGPAPGSGRGPAARPARGPAAAPVICLTAGEGSHAAKGLRPQDIGVGQDACLARPFGPRTLAGKVRAAARGAARTPASYTAGRLLVEPARRRATLDGVPVTLTGTELSVLVCLLRAAGRAVPRAALCAAVWGEDGPATDRAVDVYVAQLRAKLGPGHGIRTVRGIGYVLDTGPAAAAAPATAPGEPGTPDAGARPGGPEPPASIGGAGHPTRGDSGTA